MMLTILLLPPLACRLPSGRLLCRRIATSSRTTDMRRPATLYRLTPAGHAHTSQSLPRMLTLWFDFGTFLQAFRANKVRRLAGSSAVHPCFDPCWASVGYGILTSWHSSTICVAPIVQAPRQDEKQAVTNTTQQVGFKWPRSQLTRLGWCLALARQAGLQVVQAMPVETREAAAGILSQPCCCCSQLAGPGDGHHGAAGQERADAHVAGGAAAAHLARVPPLQRGV